MYFMNAGGRMTKAWLLVGLAACADAPARDTSGPGEVGIRLEPVASGLDAPLYLTAPAGDARSFIVEQVGRIRILRDDALLEEPFLDISELVSTGGERGLLSVAFHPDYATNGLFYVDYTDRNGDTRVVRYHVSSSPDVADPASAKLILAVPQPFSNHNGGLVLFGPDGFLYIGMGDGGSGGDPNGNGQNPSSLLGAILRLDVDNGDPYAIPAGNPYADGGGAPEVWATGVRNPWRFTFDPPSGLFVLADVGQGAWEEVDAAPAGTAGLNYGWNIMEGTHCYQAATCDRTGLTEPVHEYSHDDGCSITGGYVYRGSRLRGLGGTYFYSDYCEGWLRSLEITGGGATNHREWDVSRVGSVLSFGRDSDGELYLLSSNGGVYRISAAK
jgi:glucose/arabinose dehydrogenase